MRNNEHKLSDLISTFAHTGKVKEKLYQKKLEGQWEVLFGAAVNQYTKKIVLKNHALILYIDSAPLREELHLGKDKVQAIANGELREEYIHEVRILPA